MAQIALRDVAYWECPPGLLGMPWLLIEMCAWSLVTDGQRGVPQGLLEQLAPSTTGDLRDDSNDRLGWDRHR